jgi:hypothetical protein
MAAPRAAAAAGEASLSVTMTVIEATGGVALYAVAMRSLPATLTSLARPAAVPPRGEHRPRFHLRDARLLLGRGGLASSAHALLAVRAGAILLAAHGLPPAVVTPTRCVLLGPTPSALVSVLQSALQHDVSADDTDAPPFELAMLEALLSAALSRLAAERRMLRPLLELVGGAADAEGLGDTTTPSSHRRRVAAIDIGVPALTDSIRAAKERLRRLRAAAAGLSRELSRLLDDPSDMAGLLLSLAAAEAAAAAAAASAGSNTAQTGAGAAAAAVTTTDPRGLRRRRLAASPAVSAVGTPDPRDDAGDGALAGGEDCAATTPGKPRGRRRYGRRHHPGAVRAEEGLRRRAVTDARRLGATDAAEVRLEAALAQADALADALQRALDDLDVAEAHAALLTASAQGRLWGARVLLSALAVTLALPVALSGLLSMNLGSQAPPPPSERGGGGGSGWLSRDAVVFTAVSTAQVALAGALLAAGLLAVRRRLRAVEATPGWSVATTGAQLQ